MLKLHGDDAWLPEEALGFAARWTPRGYLSTEGITAYNEQIAYMNNPGMGAVYVVGKLSVDEIFADRAFQLGDKFSLKQTNNDIIASGRIPVSLIHWEVTGVDGSLKK